MNILNILICLLVELKICILINMGNYSSQTTYIRCTPCIGQCSTCPTASIRHEAFIRKYFPQFRHSSSVREDTRFQADYARDLMAHDMTSPVDRYDMFGS